MEREEFIAKYKNASTTIDRDFIHKLHTRADDIGLRFHEQRGHENLIIDMEELAELAQQVSKILREKQDFYSLIEEMADVQLILYHLQNLCMIADEELNKAINVKVQRYEQNLIKLENS